MAEVRKALTAGKLTTFSEGEYSDYGYRGTYVALKDLTLDELIAKGESLRTGKYYEDSGKVEALLIREGYLLEVDMTEVHLGGYGTIDISIL